jgi:hypothetical protein
MNWTLPTLLSDVADAWSGSNWIYTLAFWLLVGGGLYLVGRRDKRKGSS